MVISTAKFPPLRIAVCARERNALAKEQPFCRLHAGRDLDGVACAKPPEFEAEYLKTRYPAKLETTRGYLRSKTAEPHRLALGELEALACALLAVLLAFLHARIASQKSILAQRRAQFRIEHRNGACQAHADRSSLPANSTALGSDDHIHLVVQARELQRFSGVMLPRYVWKIFFRRSAIDLELSGTRAQKNSRNRFLTATCTQNPSLLAHEGRTSRTQRSS